ncbi:hypothetical protein NP233_g583 [Leucocoprinus birnbaumii]|uniref:Uncharacterized protein n=1 Tax=Leucocoprinus birnbaumii TaxID=56174 RepID=A0AAD5W3U9_9AGAR|nr:hypothetical protein NP233_g583 [Leucocoprinus birnbaumii]
MNSLSRGRYPELCLSCVPIFLLLFFPNFCAAAPIRDSSTSSTWLACLTTLLIFSVICLLCFKLLFVRHRRSNNLRGPSRPYIHGQYAHRCFKLFKLPAYTVCKGGKNCRAGFLIGLFGSPSLEIRWNPGEFTLVYPSADSSKSSQKHDLSGDTTTTYKTKSSTFSTGPVVLSSDKSPLHAQMHNRKHSPSSTSLNKGNMHMSRFLLPYRLSFDLGRLGRRRKPAPLEISTPLEGLPWPHNHLEQTTLRLVKLYTEPEASLPFCKGGEIMSGLSPLAHPARSFAVTHLNRPPPLPISSLPPLPALTANSDNRTLKVTFPEPIIEHPYNNVLLNLMKPGRQNTRRASLSPNLSVIEESCRDGSLPDVPSERLLDSKGEKGAPTVVDPSKSPPMAFSAYENLKRKEKRSSSLRNRRSPPLGPSPLRLMILPDMTGGDCPLLKRTTVDQIKDCPAPKRESALYQQMGLGLPSVKLPLPSKGERIKSGDSLRNVSAGSRESMLDFLHELAEETKEWDDSIVLDEGFRNMIVRSQAILGCTSLENVNLKCSTPKLSPGPTERNKPPPRFVSFWLEDSPSP